MIEYVPTILVGHKAKLDSGPRGNDGEKSPNKVDSDLAGLRAGCFLKHK